MANTKPTTVQPSGIKLEDIYYALFRHKWLILTFFSAGLIAAAFLLVTSRPIYRSNASILVRYISESTSMAEVSEGTKVKSPDYAGTSIMNSELEILNSFDLAQEVADVVGPDKILGKHVDETDRTVAAVIVSKNIKVEVPRLSNVIKVSFAHSKPEIARQVLGEMIQSYIKRHRTIHLELGIHEEFFKQQRERFRGEITAAGEQIDALRLQAGGISAEDAQSTYVQEIGRIRQEIWNAEAELEQRGRLQKDLRENPVPQAGHAATNAPGSTDQVQRYKNVVSLLGVLRERELNESMRFKADSPVLKGLRQQIAETEAQKQQLELENPSLSTLEVPVPGDKDRSPAAPAASSIAMLMIRTNVLHGQLTSLGEEVAKLTALDVKIREWQRKKALAETNLWHYLSALEQAQIADTQGPGKVSNIGIVQKPSPPFRDPSDLIKSVAIALAAGLFGGIGIALLIELVLKQTLRRPGEIEGRLGVPLFISVPDFFRNGHAKFFRRKRPKQSPPSTSVSTEPASLALLPASVNQSVQPYCEGLRDRLMTYFQSKNMTHKPKLVAVTGCARASGVTTIATGLAASLSETGDGNVLLVDMNVASGLAGHPFYKGKQGCDFLEAIEGGSKSVTPVQENLYLVSAGGSHGKEFAIIPQRFNSLLPKLKASDFDYIIFDMPPISQTSPTVGLAPFFDIVLTVVESEKTQRELAKSAMTLLQSSTANVATVLNRKRNYLPRWLHEEL